MKKRILIIYWIIGFMACICLNAKTNRKFVTNSPNPVFGQIKIGFEEKLLIEEEENPGGYFGYFGDIELDKKGNIFLIIWKKVLKFDPTGKYLATYCNVRGEGPGEFQTDPRKLFINKNNLLYVSDGYKLAKFHNNGKFIKNIRLFGVSEKFVIFNDKLCFSVFLRPKGKDRVWALLKLDFEGSSKEMVQTPNNNIVRRGTSVRLYRHYYENDIYLTERYREELCYGINKQYRLFISDSLGKTIRTIVVNEKPSKVTSKEISALIKSSPIRRTNIKNYWNDMPRPKYRPFFNKILTDEVGRIYVVRIQPILEKKSHEVIDIFGVNGRLLYRTTMPYSPEIIREGYIYAFDKSDEDNLKVIRLKIKNYSSIKY